MDKILHIVINEDIREELKAGSPADKFSDRLDITKVEYIQVKDLAQFDRLISVLKEDTKVMIWIHPNNAYKRSTTLAGTMELEQAIALKNRDIIRFNLITRVIDDDARKLAEQVGVELYRTTDIWNAQSKLVPQTVREILGLEDQNIAYPSNIQNVDVAIICALYDNEFKSVEGFVVDAIDVDGFSTLKYGRLKDSDKWVLIDFQTKMGMVDAASLTTQIATIFRPRYIIMTGVCGGREKKGANILDLAIPDNVFDFQTGKYEQGVFKPYMRACSIDNKKVVDVFDKVKAKAADTLGGSQKEKWQKIKILPTSLACGNIVVKTDGYLDGEIAKYDEQVIGVEMEGYGVARAVSLLHQHNIKPLIIKGVMDYTERGKNDSDKSDAAFFSALFAYHLAKDYL